MAMALPVALMLTMEQMAAAVESKNTSL